MPTCLDLLYSWPPTETAMRPRLSICSPVDLMTHTWLGMGNSSWVRKGGRGLDAFRFSFFFRFRNSDFSSTQVMYRSQYIIHLFRVKSYPSTPLGDTLYSFPRCLVCSFSSFSLSYPSIILLSQSAISVHVFNTMYHTPFSSRILSHPSQLAPPWPLTCPLTASSALPTRLKFAPAEAMLSLTSLTLLAIICLATVTSSEGGPPSESTTPSCPWKPNPAEKAWPSSFTKMV